LRHNLADVLLGIISQRLLPQRGGGLVLASEVLIANSAAKSLIRDGKILQIEGVIQTSKDEGMISFKKSIEKLVEEGKVNQEDVDRIKIYIWRKIITRF
jgi:twitching motility protein PilT